MTHVLRLPWRGRGLVRWEEKSENSRRLGSSGRVGSAGARCRGCAAGTICMNRRTCACGSISQPACRLARSARASHRRCFASAFLVRRTAAEGSNLPERRRSAASSSMQPGGGSRTQRRALRSVDPHHSRCFASVAPKTAAGGRLCPPPFRGGAHRVRCSAGATPTESPQLSLRDEFRVEVGAEPLDAAFAAVPGFLHAAERRLGRRDRHRVDADHA